MLRLGYQVEKIMFSLDLDLNKLLSGIRGSVFITSERVRHCPSTSYQLQIIVTFASPNNLGSHIAFPGVLISDAKFEQPIFSANAFTAKCPTIPGGSYA
jgi:hypothetical protein